MVDRAWNIIPGTICWAVWKERNARIFKEEKWSEESILTSIKQIIWESIAISKLSNFSDRPRLVDQRTLQLLELHPPPQNNMTLGMANQDAPYHWHPPDKDILKLNYDGVAKGNPGVASFGEVFKNSKGEIIWLYAGSLGKATNNAVELHALEHGLDIVKV